MIYYALFQAGERTPGTDNPGTDGREFYDFTDFTISRFEIVSLKSANFDFLPMTDGGADLRAAHLLRLSTPGCIKFSV